MSKQARARSLSDIQARAIGRNIRVSPRKLNLVAQSIRGKSAEAALAMLAFSPKRIARDVKKILESAIANAENNHDLDVDSLVVTEASVGKAMVMKRFHPRARGRSAGIQKPFSHITIMVEEKKQDAKAKSEDKAGAKAPGKNKAKAEGAKGKTAAKASAKKPAAKAAKKEKA
jgi:large subunit ribosomal protein L22